MAGATRAAICCLLLLALARWSPAALHAQDEPAATPEQEKFFEDQVRPILVNHCQKCHGAEKQESDLRMDSRAALLNGGASGEKGAIAGDPEQSLLIQAVRYDGDVQMPPEEKDKLSEAQIAILSDWVKMGLPWPKASQVAAGGVSSVEKAEQARKSHWAFQPVAPPTLPAVKNAGWVQSPVDAFVLAKLEEHGLNPSPEADRRTLIRRLTFDLTGLPPSLDEVTAFIGDASPDAYERLVDRLLAAPAHGERWGRHWLDVARYADTKGYTFAGAERKYPYSYTYRDYVIGAFNEDRPYDRFVTEQLAADLLPAEGDNSHLAALGFLTVGRKFNNQHDDLDDLIDVTSRGLIGMTVACARCHDHKYDAIPTEDYYSLYGVFASIEPPAEMPLLGTPTQTAEYTAYLAELNKRKQDLTDYRQQKRVEFIEQARKQSADYLAKVLAGRNGLLEKLPFLSLDPKDVRPRLVERWRGYLRDRAKPEHAVWGLWRELSELTDDNFAAKAPEIVAQFRMRPDGNEAQQLNAAVKGAFTADTPANRMDVARIYGKLLTDALQLWQQAGANAEALAKLAPEQRALAEVLVGSDSPVEVPLDELRGYLNRAERNREGEIKKKVDQYEANSSAAPPRAMSVADKSQPHDPRVFIRGNHARPGKPVPRQFLLVLSSEAREPFQQGSGRLELARAIVAPENPLTRRVIANRLWMHHFGEPLVNTPSDFGIRSDVPVHPQLLDYLATKLLEAGWSLKTLHREIVLSSTYRQTSADRPDCRQVDPENRLLWRMNTRRLEWEAARDSLQAVAGRLDQQIGGRPVDLTGGSPSRRRAVYGLLDRQDLPGLFRVFDIASPDQSTPRRPQTTVPQQSLFLMNSPFVMDQAKSLAARLPSGEGIADSERIAALYRLTLQREPSESETAIGSQFLATVAGNSDAASKLNAWEQYAQLLLLTNEFMYID